MKSTIKFAFIAICATLLCVACKKEDRTLENRTFRATAVDNDPYYVSGSDYYELKFWANGEVWYKHFADEKTQSTLGYPKQDEKIRYRYSKFSTIVFERKDGVEWVEFGTGKYEDNIIAVEFRYSPYTNGEKLTFREI